MRIQNTGTGKRVWLSANDTYDWAHRPGVSWPCSVLSGNRIYAEFDEGGDLVDVSINGGRGDQDCPGDEFNAIMTDLAGVGD